MTNATRWPEEIFPSIRLEVGPHVCKRTEFVCRSYDQKWVRWELVNTSHEPQEGKYPFESATCAREMWIATGVWHDRPDNAMKEIRDGYRKRT
jgi:hypothetical protein